MPVTADAAARYRAALAAAGGTGLTEFDLTGYDRVGLPVRAAVCDGPGGPESGADAHGVGYGATVDVATVGALGEIAERMLIGPEVAALPVTRDSFARLRARLGERAVADPVSLVLDAGCDYDEQRELSWVPATRWATGETVLVPRDLVRSAPGPGDDGLITPVTNGLGAGESLERAVAHGLLELVQRDGDNLRFRALDRGTVVDLTSCADPDVRHAVAVLRAAGVEPTVKLASTELACVVYCVGRDDDPHAAPMALSAIGEAAHPDRAVAVAKAVLEYASSRARRVFAFGPWDDVVRRDPHYARAEQRRPLGAQEPRALAAMREWSTWDADRMRTALGVLHRERRRVAWTDLPTSPARDPAQLLADLLPRVDDVLVVPAQAGGMHAAKVISPGLEVETLSYLRAGARAVAQLFDLDEELDAGLVGRGEPDGPHRRAVHLSTADREKFGGPVWIDAEAVGRVVGELYPLYREPRRHAVAGSVA